MRARLGQDHRYEHSVRVARCADVLAQCHGLDASKARLAGMLHDLARLYAPARLIAECDRRGMPIDEFERANPVVLHARLGAAIASEAFDVRDADVLSAIEKHTTAAGEMSPLDCTIYLADGLEPGRDFPERAALWHLATHDIENAMRATLLHTFHYLSQKGIPVAPQTVAAARTLGLDLKEVHSFAN
ncbi:MAG: bis(5'-nucleosyl)-tetraphosphatase (symmetrical) YqeK [Candidatus Tumulicola sp.]